MRVCAGVYACGCVCVCVGSWGGWKGACVYCQDVCTSVCAGVCVGVYVYLYAFVSGRLGAGVCGWVGGCVCPHLCSYVGVCIYVCVAQAGPGTGVQLASGRLAVAVWGRRLDVPSQPEGIVRWCQQFLTSLFRCQHF